MSKKNASNLSDLNRFLTSRKVTGTDGETSIAEFLAASPGNLVAGVPALESEDKQTSDEIQLAYLAKLIERFSKEQGKTVNETLSNLSGWLGIEAAEQVVSSVEKPVLEPLNTGYGIPFFEMGNAIIEYWFKQFIFMDKLTSGLVQKHAIKLKR